MKSRMLCLAASLLCLCSWQASAQTLSVGDNAPALEVSSWAKGEKVDRLEKDRTYVVEFWATWCGPCKTSIPHLTQLQKAYKDKGVQFIGVSVWENNQDAVAPFVKEMGDKMDYSVALDVVPKGEGGNKGKMAESWMTASESNGIPTAFIVKDGKIAWIGHPMLMDSPLEKVTSGNFDISKAAEEFRQGKAKEKAIMAVLQKIMALGRAAPVKDRLAVIDKSIKENPELEGVLGAQKYVLMLQSGDKEASAYGMKLIEGPVGEESQALNQIAWMNLDPTGTIPEDKRDYKLAFKAAVKANELTKGENGPILDTVALAYFKTGNPAKALELQEKAVKLMGDSDAGVKDRLNQYRKAVEDNKKP